MLDFPAQNRRLAANFVDDRIGEALGRSAPTQSLKRWLAKFAAFELLIVAVATYLGAAAYHRFVIDQDLPSLIYVFTSGAIALMVLATSVGLRNFASFDSQRKDQIVWNALGSVALSFSILLSLIFLLKRDIDYSRGSFIVQFAFAYIAVVGLRLSASWQLHRQIIVGSIEAHRVAIVGNQQYFDGFVDRLREKRVFRTATFSTNPDFVVASSEWEVEQVRVASQIRAFRPDEILLVATRLDENEVLMDSISELPARILVAPQSIISLLPSGQVVDFGAGPAFQVSPAPMSAIDLAAKRFIDIAGSLVAIVLLSPLMVMVSLAIKLTSPGPILFRQLRQGCAGELITVLKFRTMRHVTEESGFRQATANDDRITSIGRLLRRASIDELPQLFNVLRGDMSLVGPRPHVLEHNQTFKDSLLKIGRRHSVKPGITGWAQVNGLRGPTDTLQKMRLRLQYDLYYVDHWSLTLDLKILLWTLFSRATHSNAL